MSKLDPVVSKMTGLIGKEKPSKADAIAGVTTGVANVPDGMASAVLGGVNPIYGIYTLIIGTPVGALTQSTQLMMFNTTSAMTLVAADGLGDRSGDERVQAIIVIALIAGIMQVALGVLGLGMLTKFVSNSVMVGFLTGIATMIVLGQLWDLTGFEGEKGTKLQDTAQLFANLGDVDPATTFIGVGSLVVMVAFSYTKKLANFNLLIALAVAIVVQLVFDFQSVALVGEIPSSIPTPKLPELSLMPAMLLAGIATGAVGLLQGAGVAQAFPNPDGSETSDSRDFWSQGVANISASMFQGMGGGGSLSGTALNVSAGARTRWANVFQAAVVLVVILVFSGVLAKIPSAALAALLVYAAVLSIKWGAINTVQKTSWASLVAMLLTFLATLVVPLQNAVIFGVIVASVLYIYRASTDVRVQEVTIENGRLIVSDPPELLPSNEVTVLDIEGNLFYAGSRTLSDRLPDAMDAKNAFAILRMRGQGEVGSTFFKVIGHYAQQIEAGGGHLILAGVPEETRDRMERTGNLDQIGAENVFLSTSIIGDSTVAAVAYGQSLLAGVPSEQLSIADLVPDAAPVSADSGVTVESVTPPSPEQVFDDQGSVYKRIAGVVDTYLPWRSTASWQSTAVLGAVLLAVGLLIQLDPSILNNVFRGVIGAVFVGVAGFWIYQTFSSSGLRLRVPAATRMLSAGIALMAGSALMVSEVSDLMPEDGARLMSNLSVIFIGLIGLAGTIIVAGESRERLVRIGINGAMIAAGAYGLYRLDQGVRFYESLAWPLIAVGAALVLFAIYLMRTGAAIPAEPELVDDLGE